MKFKNIIGIDIGKSTLEFCYLSEGNQLFQKQIENNPKAINQFLKQLKLSMSETLFCMEHTGIYNLHLLSCLSKLKASIWLENPIQIKRSMGLIRGKNDKIDAFRIAEYARKNQEAAELWKPGREIIIRLKALLSQRSRLNKAKKILAAPLNEASEFMGKANIRSLKQSCNVSLKGINKDLKSTLEQIKQLIKNDPTLNRLFTIITSVPNVGTIVASSIIVSTNEFQKINTARKFACQCGVAPYEHSSGTSIRGKTRVSHYADKELKTLLHLSALSAVSRPGELKDYFMRKVKEGKNKMSVINAIRNKLIHQVFACIRDQRKYIKKDLTLA